MSDAVVRTRNESQVSTTFSSGNEGGGAGNRIRFRGSINDVAQATEIVDGAVAGEFAAPEADCSQRTTASPGSDNGHGTPTVRRPHKGEPPSLSWLRGQTLAEPCALVPGPCWIWQRAKTNDGYGRLSISGRDSLAHRVAYELAHGPVFCWLTLDHLCRRRDCINPAHLEPVTQAVNILRGNAPCAVAARTGFCVKGHPVEPVGGRMRCKVCQAERQREWYERRKALAVAAHAMGVLR